MQSVKIYSTKICPFCTRVKQFFDQKGVSYSEIDLTNDDAARAKLVEQTNHRTVPQVFIGDTFVGGYDDVVRLDGEGEIDRLLGGEVS